MNPGSAFSALPENTWRLVARQPTAIGYRLLVAAALLVPAFASLAAPALPELVDPASQGFSTERLARIDARMNEAVRDGVMVGGHALIARRGKLVYEQVWGMADREMGRPLEDDALYRIYSMTKPVTAVALLMLYEEGHFLLEDPVAKYLPELADLSLARENDAGEVILEAPARQPTIRDLLRHTAGFSYGLFSDFAVDRLYREADLLNVPDTATFTNRLGQLPLLFEPGTRWYYSVAVDVQARLVEVISEQRFGDFLRDRIFEPLGMDDTFFVIPPEEAYRLTQLYSPAGTELDWKSAWKFTDEVRLEPANPDLTQPYFDGNLFESGGAGLVSSAHDYLRFALMLAGGGAYDGVRLLGTRTVEHLRSNHLQGLDNSGLWGMEAFGLGVGTILATAATNGELGADGAYGWGGAAGTNFWVDPEGEIVGVFMVQSIPHQTPLAKKFRVLTYQALIE